MTHVLALRDMRSLAPTQTAGERDAGLSGPGSCFHKVPATLLAADSWEPAGCGSEGTGQLRGTCRVLH